MTPAPVPVVIVNYNNAASTMRCLRSLARIERPSLRPIVVDNASTDDSVGEIRRSYPNIEIVVAPANRGFGAGNNVALGGALIEGSPFVWLLNNDTEVDPDCLRLLIERANADPRLGVVGAMIYELEDRERIQVAGGGYLQERLALTRHRYSQSGPLDFVTGVSMLVRREVLRSTGGFDERFFLYCEDVDFCVRAVAAGWRLGFEPGARVWHEGGATTSSKGSRRPAEMDRVFAASTALFIRKHGGRGWPLWLTVRVILMLARRLTPARVGSLRSMVAGVSDGLKAFR